MQTILALFDRYEDARAAVQALMDRDFGTDKMNAIVQEQVAKTNMNVSWKTVDVEVTDDVGHQRLFGLDQMLGREQPVRLTHLGNVYAAGEMANFVATTAASPEAADGGLEEALREFDVPADAARAFDQGVRQGDLLFWIRIDDERAMEAGDILREQKARHVTRATY